MAARKPAGTTPARPRGPGGRFVAAPKAAKPAATAKLAASAKPAPKPAETAKPAPKAETAKPPATDTPGPASLSLYILRHADAGDSATWTGDDAVRPLSKKGRRQARRLGRHLGALGIGIDVLLTSPRIRALDTAKLVGKALGAKARVDARLDAGFDPGGLRDLVSEIDESDSSVMIVGHDPDFSTVASWLTDAPLALRKGALVRIDLPDRKVASGIGALRWLLPPDAVPD